MLYKATLIPKEIGPNSKRLATTVEAESPGEAAEKMRAAFPNHRPSYVTAVDTTRQKLITIGEDGTAKCRVKPRRLWTILGEGEIKLPFTPIHHETAFLEDETHDWSWKKGVLRYYSRVAEPPVRVLAEY